MLPFIPFHRQKKSSSWHNKEELNIICRQPIKWKRIFSSEMTTKHTTVPSHLLHAQSHSIRAINKYFKSSHNTTEYNSKRIDGCMSDDNVTPFRFHCIYVCVCVFFFAINIQFSRFWYAPLTTAHESSTKHNTIWKKEFIVCQKLFFLTEPKSHASKTHSIKSTKNHPALVSSLCHLIIELESTA